MRSLAASADALLRGGEPLLWINPRQAYAGGQRVSTEPREPARVPVLEAQARFARFAPLLAQLFPELAVTHGQIESPLVRAARLQRSLPLRSDHGSLWLKCDHLLPVAGSIKARGGFHEVLEFAEQVLRARGVLGVEDGATLRLAAHEARAALEGCEVAVGSTGNLGLSIGTLARALGTR